MNQSSLLSFSLLLTIVSIEFTLSLAEVRINPILTSDDVNETRHTTPTASREPHFASDSSYEVTAAVGNPAHIPCKARSLGAKSVSWIRHRDLHVLTVGAFAFTNDDRFSAHRDPSSGDWVLVIRRPELTDSGMYECSISTKPVITHTVKLSIVVPSAELLGGPDVFLDRGSALNLTCVVHHSPVAPEFVLWYHRGELVNYAGGGQGVDVETSHTGGIARSSLLVNNTTHSDSGLYSCKPSNAGSVTVTVHVLKSETPAAMQTTNSSSLSSHAPGHCSLFLLLLLPPLLAIFLCNPNINRNYVYARMAWSGTPNTIPNANGLLTAWRTAKDENRLVTVASTVENGARTMTKCRKRRCT